MGQEHVDPAYGYIDKKVKLLKREIKQLKNAHDAVASEQSAAILQTQRFLAKLHIRVIHNESIDCVKDKAVAPDFISELTLVMNKVDSSNRPLFLAAEFGAKRWGKLKELGATSITLSLE